MDEYTRILVIILGSVLAITLILAITALVKFIQILDHIKRIVEKAEQIADKAESVTEFFQKTAAPMAVARLVGNIAESFMNRKKSKKD
jgi:hypothetical protein